MACLIAAVASLLRGKQYVHELHSESAVEATADVESSADLVAEAERAAAAEGPATPRVAIAEEIQESSERLGASPEPATPHLQGALAPVPGTARRLSPSRRAALRPRAFHQERAASPRYRHPAVARDPASS